MNEASGGKKRVEQVIHTCIATMSLSSLSSSRAWTYFAERGEDALHAVKGALGGLSSSKYLDLGDDKLVHVRAQLESMHDVERLEGMKMVVAMISKGRDASPYLASVFKLTSTNSLEVRKLVYLVVLRYAPSHPDLALLSINSFQRDLADPNPLIRGMALRTLSGMRLKTISEIVMLAVSKAMRDPHPYVRRIAAYALPKCYELDAENHDRIQECVTTFLRDRSPSVLGAIMCVFDEVCHDRWDLLHRHFRKLCQALGDMSEWAQPTCIAVLVRYTRVNIPRPTDGNVDADLDLFLTSVASLATSMNPLVVMSVLRAIEALVPERTVTVFPALLRLVRSSHDISYMATVYALTIAESKHVDMSSYLPTFLVRASDPMYLARTKLHVLMTIATPAHASLLARELAVYTHMPCVPVAMDSVTALGHLAHKFERHNECLALLMEVIQDPVLPAPVLSRAVQVIKTLLRASTPSTAASIVARFTLRLFVPLAERGRAPDAPKLRILTDPASRASVLWMLGQYANAPLADASLLTLLVPDVMRCLVAHWSKEHANVQCQALALSAKAYVLLPVVQDVMICTAITVLHYEILHRASQSSHADVRIRARFFSGLTRGLTDADTELNAAPSYEVKTYLASHQRLDMARLPGVRLRRAQVQHVLFAHDASHDEGELFTLSRDIYPGAYASMDVPDWREHDALPPPIVRMPDTSSVQKDTCSENQRSLSSDMFAHARPERVVLEPRTNAKFKPKAPSNARYADLDSFFADESEEASISEELDDAAPEDEEYTYTSSSDEYDAD